MAMTPQARAEFDRRKRLVERLVKVEHVRFIENVKRRCVSAAIDPAIERALGALRLDDIADVVLTTPSSGQVLEYNGTNWVNATDNT